MTIRLGKFAAGPVRGELRELRILLVGFERGDAQLKRLHPPVGPAFVLRRVGQRDILEILYGHGRFGLAGQGGFGR